jgi:SAM-dependent methyltransferase
MKVENKEQLIKNNYYKIVIQHRETFLQKPALRAVYKHWAHYIKGFLSAIEGKSIELGCGCGALSQFLPQLISTDIYKHDWVNEVVDACSMPYADNACANFVAVDMLHHLYDLSEFFNEVNRALKKGGRLIMLEPYISAVSFIVYHYFHHEPVDMKVFPFTPIKIKDASGEAANTALPTLLFMRYRSEFIRRWPQLKIFKIELRDGIIYPLTGGFSRRNWLPPFLIEFLMNIEDIFLRFSGCLQAMRMLIVIEKVS